MQRLTLTLILLFTILTISAQQTLTATTPMTSPKASISQTVGITKIEVIYSRPAVNNREVWGQVVRFSPESIKRKELNIRPWRAGANENTVVYFSTDVFVGEKSIEAGYYGLHMFVQSNGEVDCVFSSNYKSWGSYYFNAEEVVTQIKVKWRDREYVERLTFEFNSLTENSVELSLNWGDKRIPIPIQVDVKSTTLKSLQQEIQSKHMINYIGPQEAADWCLRNDTNLEQALGWSNYSISFVKVFSNVKTKSELLRKLGKVEEAEKMMQEALFLGTVFEIHTYGSGLLKQQKTEQAFEVFRFNAKKHVNVWPVNYGLAKAYSAKSDYKAAVKYMNKAIKNSPNKGTLGLLNSKLDQLKKGEDIN